MKQYYIFDNLEIIMGPYDTAQQAYDDLKLHIDELYLLDHYPEPYADVIGDGEFEGVVGMIEATRHYHTPYKLSTLGVVYFTHERGV